MAINRNTTEARGSLKPYAEYACERMRFLAAPKIWLRLVVFVVIVAAVECWSQSNRPFAMSSTAIQAYPNEPILYQNFSTTFPLSTLATDIDLVTVFPEYLGIPFGSFAASTAPPTTDPWTIQMTALANAAKSTGKPLMVEIVLTRQFPVANAVNNNGTLELQSSWAPNCMDFTSTQYATVGTAYVNYAKWIATEFSPKYLVIMIENNLYYVNCGGNTPSWQVLVSIEQQAYDAVKAQFPSMIVFPSFKLEDLYDQLLSGFDQPEYSALSALKRDRLGIAAYPFGVKSSAGFINPYQLPADYLTRVRDRNPGEPPVVITETGWNSASIAILYNSLCYGNIIYSDPTFETAYLQFLIYSGYAGSFDVITWWSDRDLISSSVMNTCPPLATAPNFPECNGDQWCVAINTARSSPSAGWSPAFAELAFKAFGSMGLRNYDGAAKSGSLSFWNSFLALP